MQRDSQDEQEGVGALVFGVEVPDARHERLNRGFLHLGKQCANGHFLSHVDDRVG